MIHHLNRILFFYWPVINHVLTRSVLVQIELCDGLGFMINDVKMGCICLFLLLYFVKSY